MTPISEPVITQEHTIGIMLPIKKHVAWLKGVWSDEKSLEDLRSNTRPSMLHKIVINS